MRGTAAWKRLSAAAAGLLLAGGALADEPFQLTTDQLDSVTAGGIVALADNGALAMAFGEAALALTATASSVDSSAGHATLQGHAKAVAIGNLDAASLAVTELLAANDSDVQAVTLGAEGLGGGGIVVQAETLGHLELAQDSVAAEGTALSSGDESIASSAMRLTTSVPNSDLDAAAAADGLSTGGATTLSQTLGQLDAEALAANIAAHASADDVALGSAAALLSLDDGDSTLSIVGLAEAAAAGDAAVLAEASGQIYDSRSVDRGHISSTAVAVGAVAQQSTATTGAAGSGNIVIMISNTMGRLIDATDTSPPIARTHSSATIVTVNAP